MKKLYLVAAFLGFAFFAKAQENSGSNKKQQDIEALKVAFISRELDLTPEEAQKFWPVYNQYSNELKGVVQDDQDVIDRDEKVLNLRKKYRDQFTKVLGPQRMNRLYNAEGRFRQILIKAIKNQRLQRNNTNRPLQRKG
ncbi:MAG: hypothetical protein ABJB11_02065 [Ferruginibacter sp.]